MIPMIMMMTSLPILFNNNWPQSTHHRGLQHNLSSQCNHQRKTISKEKARVKEATMGEDRRRNGRDFKTRSQGLVRQCERRILTGMARGPKKIKVIHRDSRLPYVIRKKAIEW
jgi:hypothetical protein